ncbi:pectinesterase inhibitor-like [Vicia villosa]|uniref:pectinesterase inhibitor-like n=1 Tax=Vicia villosa TaxID=3911 RepID=UPI00273BE345|nr:pectinesterase inhibitor-like [Vicia villosa]
MIRFSFCVFVFTILLPICSSTNKVVDVDAICKQTKDPSFCSNLLNSKPGGVGQDLVSLVQYTLDVALSNTTNTVHLIQVLIAQKGSDVEAQFHYNVCYRRFENVIDGIVNARESLKLRDYYNAISSVGHIRLMIDYCLKGSGPGEPPYHGNPMVPKYADVVDQVAIIMDFILRKLCDDKSHHNLCFFTTSTKWVIDPSKYYK